VPTVAKARPVLVTSRMSVPAAEASGERSTDQAHGHSAAVSEMYFQLGIAIGEL